MKSVKTLKKLTQQEVSEWPMVKLVKNRLKETDRNMEYQGVTIPDFDETAERCSRDVMADLRYLDGKIKACLEWSDTDLLRAVVAFLNTHNWLMREDTQDSDEEGIMDPDEVGSDMREAVEYIITAFRAPLEVGAFQQKLFLTSLKKQLVTHESIYQLPQRPIKRFGTHYTLAQMLQSGQTYSCNASSS